MKSTSLPTTALGKWSLGFVIAAILCFFIFIIEITALGFRGGDTWTWDWQTMPIIIAGVTFVSAFVTGIISILKYKERAVLAILSTGFGLLVLIFLLGEFLSPH
jgi:hypothetical protein